jgi:hypothetical protein
MRYYLKGDLLSHFIVGLRDDYLWGYLLHHYHYLGLPKLVGEHLKYLAYADGQVVACLAWASAAFKVKSRDEFIGWDTTTRKHHLNLIANNARFLVLPWVQVKFGYIRISQLVINS